MPKRQYPPQTGPFIVKVKSNQSTDKWADFATARFQISVGQAYHEGEKLKAVAAWAKARFDKIYFCANDTLQRFNLMFEQGVQESEAQQEAAQLGQQWLKRNATIIKSVPQARVVHWEEWKSKPQYPKGFLQTEWLYQNNPAFKKAIDDNILAIWTRRQAVNPRDYTQDRYTDFAALSRRYLIEEMATFALMYETEVAIDIYPGTTLFAATLFKDKEIKGAPPGLGKGHFSRIDFLKNDRS